VATISRFLKITGLFCKRALQKRLLSATETYNFKEPTSRSHPIFVQFKRQSNRILVYTYYIEYVCIHIYVRKCMRTCVRFCSLLDAHAHWYSFQLSRQLVFDTEGRQAHVAHTDTDTDTHTGIHRHWHRHKQTHINTYTQTRMSTHTHTHTRTRTHRNLISIPPLRSTLPLL